MGEIYGGIKMCSRVMIVSLYYVNSIKKLMLQWFFLLIYNLTTSVVRIVLLL